MYPGNRIIVEKTMITVVSEDDSNNGTPLFPRGRAFTDSFLYVNHGAMPGASSDLNVGHQQSAEEYDSDSVEEHILYPFEENADQADPVKTWNLDDCERPLEGQPEEPMKDVAATNLLPPGPNLPGEEFTTNPFMPQGASYANFPPSVPVADFTQCSEYRAEPLFFFVPMLVPSQDFNGNIYNGIEQWDKASQQWDGVEAIDQGQFIAEDVNVNAQPDKLNPKSLWEAQPLSPKKPSKLAVQQQPRTIKTRLQRFFGLEDRTTVMIRNIPNNTTRKMLLDVIDSAGFACCYDFVYLPVDFERGANLGYAFVNMINPEIGKQIMEHFDGFAAWAHSDSDKVCETMYGDPLQGLEAHVNRYRNSPVMHKNVPDEFKPLLFVNGVPTPLPPPTRRLRMPRTNSRWE